MGTIWVGVDDTDAKGSGCTTWVLTELLGLAREQRLDPIGPPRLVRLNPNIPWKTRGNAALSVRLGHGRGRRRWVGTLSGRRLFAYASGAEPTTAELERFARAAWQVVLDASPEAEGTDPALVVASRRPSPELYWKAVREVVAVDEARAALDAVGALVRTRGDPRGLVGAAAAIAWPARRGTWELLSYRQPERVGKPRTIDPETVRAAQRADRRLFLCHDPVTRRLLVAPHTGCPVLFGLRATAPEAAVRALRTVRSEPWERWVLFRTNQATGDHLLRRSAASIVPFLSAILPGTVSAPPRALAGGHVLFSVRDEEGDEVRCVAFEPTKTLPRVAQALLPGDRVVVWGSASRPATLRLEGIRLVRRVRVRRLSAPACPRCGGRTGSLGRGRGWRCRSCRLRLPPEHATTSVIPRAVRPGTYHPTPSARRHLAPRATEPAAARADDPQSMPRATDGGPGARTSSRAPGLARAFERFPAPPEREEDT